MPNSDLIALNNASRFVLVRFASPCTVRESKLTSRHFNINTASFTCREGQLKRHRLAGLLETDIRGMQRNHARELDQGAALGVKFNCSVWAGCMHEELAVVCTGTQRRSAAITTRSSSRALPSDGRPRTQPWRDWDVPGATRCVFVLASTSVSSSHSLHKSAHATTLGTENLRAGQHGPKPGLPGRGSCVTAAVRLRDWDVHASTCCYARRENCTY